MSENSLTQYIDEDVEMTDEISSSSTALVLPSGASSSSSLSSSFVPIHDNNNEIVNLSLKPTNQLDLPLNLSLTPTENDYDENMVDNLSSPLNLSLVVPTSSTPLTSSSFDFPLNLSSSPLAIENIVDLDSPINNYSNSLVPLNTELVPSIPDNENMIIDLDSQPSTSNVQQLKKRKKPSGDIIDSSSSPPEDPLPKQKRTETQTPKKIKTIYTNNVNAKYYTTNFESDTKSLSKFTNISLDVVYKNFPNAHLTSKRIFYQHLKVLNADIEKYKREFESITNSSKKLINITEKSIKTLQTLNTQLNSTQSRIVEFLRSLPFDDFLIVLSKLKIEHDLYDGNLSSSIENMLSILKNKIITDLSIPKPIFILGGTPCPEQKSFVLNSTYSVFLIMVCAVNHLSLKLRAKTNTVLLKTTSVSEFFKAFDGIIEETTIKN